MFGLDIVLLALVAALLPVCVWRPWIGVLVFTWLGRLARSTRGDPQRAWIGGYARGIALAVIAFAAGGVFVNLPYFDVYLELVAVTVVLQELALSADGTACALADERLIAVALRCAPATLRIA